jgi:hypothetical protein
MADGGTHLLFVWSPSGYELREEYGELPQVGFEFDEGDLKLIISKIGVSPLPGDDRPCAFSIGR